MKDLTFKIEYTLKEGTIIDVLDTAFEGGIGYWACLDNTHPDWVEARKQWKEAHKTEQEPNPIPCFSEVALQVMQNGKAVILIDEEDETEYQLTLEKLVEGCRIYTIRKGKDIQKALDEADFDANDADAIIQYALFGDIIYG